MTYRVKIADHMDLFRAAHEVIRPPASEILMHPAEYVKSAWRERYGVDIVYENSRAQYLDFKDEKHFMVFLLGVDQNVR